MSLAIIESQIALARSEQKTSCPPEAAREFALAITHLEDAAMRLTRGLLMKGGAYPEPTDYLTEGATASGSDPEQQESETTALTTTGWEEDPNESLGGA